PSYFMRRHVHDEDQGLERVWRSSILPLLEEHHYGQNLDLDSLYGLASLRRALARETGGHELEPSPDQAFENTADPTEQ
ncbi:MAG: DUF4357 domain-containing protein, partial [Actinomycetota bacterium]